MGAALLSALAGVATIPVAYLVGRELRGARAGVIAAALVAVNPMLLWYSQEARAYALLGFFCALSLLYCVRAPARRMAGTRVGKRDFVLWGVFSALALATHYFAVFPLVAEVVLLARRRGRAILSGLWIVAVAVVLLAPLAIHQMSYGHAEWIGKFSLGHRRRRSRRSPSWSARPATSSAAPSSRRRRCVPLALVAAAFVLLLARGEPRRAPRRLRPRSRSAAAAVGIPLLLAIVSAGKDFVLARNLLPALVPLLLAVAVALSTRAGAPARHRDRRRPGRLLARLLRSRPAPRPSCSGRTGDAVADHLGEPDGPRATVTWVLGEAPLRFYLSTGAIQLKASEGYDWLVREVAFVSMGEAPPPPRRLLGPRLPRNRRRRRRAAVHPPLPGRRPGARAAAPARAAPRPDEFSKQRRPTRRCWPLTDPRVWGRELSWWRPRNPARRRHEQDDDGARR